MRTLGVDINLKLAPAPHERLSTFSECSRAMAQLSSAHVHLQAEAVHARLSQPSPLLIPSSQSRDSKFYKVHKTGRWKRSVCASSKTYDKRESLVKKQKVW